MKIELKKIKVSELCHGYVNNDEEGVIGYNGKLNIRPKYQREFVYKDKQRDEVIHTIRKKFPLNIMYWVKNSDGTFEVLDGQQRTLSICDYVDGVYSINYRYFHNLTEMEKEEILNYELMVYWCEGNEREKLDWFKTINIAGEKLTNQELRNAIYTGEWLTDAKKYFSKSQCPAYQIGNKYLNGTPIRQDYLETTLKWISDDNIEKYMSVNQSKPNANELWTYYQNVINWVDLLFIHYRKEMKGIDFGFLYNEFKDNEYDGKNIENDIASLMLDDDVTNKKGIYSYILTKNEKYLNIRVFTEKQKRELFENQNGTCPLCKKNFNISEMEADHVKPWSKGGKTNTDNGQMLCQPCNRTKSDK